MIDVIREKKPKDERSLNQMKASLEADFGEMSVLENNFVISSEATAKSRDLLSTIMKDSSTAVGITNQSTLLSKKMKKIKKAERTQIDELLQKFLDSYIASTTFDVEENLTQDLLQTLQERYHL